MTGITSRDLGSPRKLDVTVSAAASILIVNYNSGSYLATCVAALKNQTRSDIEVVILDNASCDDSIDNARQATDNDSRFRFILETQNLGFAAGNNRAAEYARTDWLITLNPDAFPEPKWLETLLAAASANPRIAHFGSTQLSAEDPTSLDGAGDRYFVAGIPWRDRSSAKITRARADNRETYETFAACAAAAMYRADVFRKLGGFDERFFCFVEDIDLGFRLRLMGYPCLQVINARVAHVGGGAGGGTSEFARYHGTRNLIWCFFKNTPTILVLILSPAHLLILAILATRAIVSGSPGPTLRGIRDGLYCIRKMRAAARRTKSGSSSVWNVISAMDWSPLGYLRRNQSSSNTSL